MLSSYCLTNKLLNNRELSFVIKPVIRTLCLSRFHCAKRKNESNLRQYFLSRYMQFMERFTAVLDQRFPTTMRVYRQFTWGTKDFFKDVKQFVVIVKKKNAAYPQGFQKLQRHEIELYYQVPKDIAKVTPTLVLSTAPFAFYVLLPLVYLFPRQLLTVHFWTLQQRSEFLVLNQRKRVRAYKPALRSLQAQLESIKAHPCYEDWEYIIRLLGSGLHPDPRVIIECIPLFVGPPYHTRKIYASHVRSLLRVHGLHPGWRGRTRLEYRSKILFHLDRAIIREGGVSTLTIEELRRSCAFRGLNPTNLDSEEMITWLDNWIFVSSKVDKDSWSLLLHCPLLLSYNHPNNWILKH